MNFFENPGQEIHTTEPGDGSFAHTLVEAEAAGYNIIRCETSIMDGTDIMGLPTPAKEGKVEYYNPILKELVKAPKTLLYFAGVENATPAVRDMVQRIVENRTMPMGEELPADTVIVATTS